MWNGAMTRQLLQLVFPQSGQPSHARGRWPQRVCVCELAWQTCALQGLQYCNNQQGPSHQDSAWIRLQRSPGQPWAGMYSYMYKPYQTYLLSNTSLCLITPTYSTHYHHCCCCYHQPCWSHCCYPHCYSPSLLLLPLTLYTMVFFCPFAQMDQAHINCFQPTDHKWQFTWDMCSQWSSWSASPHGTGPLRGPWPVHHRSQSREESPWCSCSRDNKWQHPFCNTKPSLLQMSRTPHLFSCFHPPCHPTPCGIWLQTIKGSLLRSGIRS